MFLSNSNTLIYSELLSVASWSGQPRMEGEPPCSWLSGETWGAFEAWAQWLDVECEWMWRKPLHQCRQCLRQLFRHWPMCWNENAQDKLQMTFATAIAENIWTWGKQRYTVEWCWVKGNEKQSKTCTNLSSHLCLKQGPGTALPGAAPAPLRCGATLMLGREKSNGKWSLTQSFLNMNAKTIETSAWVENDCSQSTPLRRTTSELKKAATWK